VRADRESDSSPPGYQLALYAIDLAVPIAIYYLLRDAGISNLLASAGG
jgi:hypothetical protein